MRVGSPREKNRRKIFFKNKSYLLSIKWQELKSSYCPCKVAYMARQRKELMILMPNQNGKFDEDIFWSENIFGILWITLIGWIYRIYVLFYPG